MSDEQHPDKNSAGNQDRDGGASVELPQINFSTFILSLNSSALVHLGLETDPSTGSQAANLPLAKQTIDILAMLAEKTSGNLTNDEQRLLTNIVYELRLMYVKQKEASSS